METTIPGVVYELVGYVKGIGIRMSANGRMLDRGEHKDALKDIARFHGINIAPTGKKKSNSTHRIFGKVVNSPNVWRIA